MVARIGTWQGTDEELDRLQEQKLKTTALLEENRRFVKALKKVLAGAKSA